MSSPGGGRWLGEPLDFPPAWNGLQEGGGGGGNERKSRDPVAGKGWLAGRGAASDGRVRDLLSANELAGRLSMHGCLHFFSTGFVGPRAWSAGLG